MASKLKTGQPLNATQAVQCRRLLEWLAGPIPKGEGGKPLANSDLDAARRVLLLIEPYERSEAHVQLAKTLHRIWQSEEITGKREDSTKSWSYMVLGMARHGASWEALQELYGKWNEPEYKALVSGENKLIEKVAQDLAREGHEQELLQLHARVEEDDLQLAPRLHEIITMFYAQNNRVPEVKEWFVKPMPIEGQVRAETYYAVASFARRNGLQEWAKPFFKELMERHPRKTHWHVVLQAMLLMGEDLSNVRKTLLSMQGPNGPLTADTSTINAMLDVACDTLDAGLADEVLAIANEESIRTDAETYLRLMSLHLAAGSPPPIVDAAFEKFQEAGALEPDAPMQSWAQYAQLLNRYLLYLTRQRPVDFKAISKILKVMEEEMLHLNPDTAAALCLRFLENEQTYDVLDILSANIFRYSGDQRDLVQQAIMSFTLDPQTSTARAWNAYQIMKEFFQDLSRERREAVLHAFFDRKRPDMATHVISHMRQHSRMDVQPTIDTYVSVFEGFAKNPDRQGTENVHNMLKMDVRIQPDTRLNTALMLAYAACERPLYALDFWNEIKFSAEGPTYGSLAAVFWVLERKSDGAKMARDIWAKIESMDLEVPANVYTNYIGVIAAQGDEKEVRGLVTKMASFTGVEPDAMTLGVAFNALPGDDLQASFKEWAKQQYPVQWTALQKKRKHMNEHGLCEYRISRKLCA